MFKSFGNSSKTTQYSSATLNKRTVYDVVTENVFIIIKIIIIIIQYTLHNTNDLFYILISRIRI